MNYNQPNNTCLFNTLYVQYVEDIGRNEFFYYDLKYPVFYNVKNGYFQVNDSVLQNLNDAINSSVYTFKQGILEEEQQLNLNNPDGSKSKINYKVYSNYDITFNKNQVISLILSLTALDNNNPQYNDLYNYNIDLLTGNQILLKDIFRPNVDYLKLIDFAIKNGTNYFTFNIPNSKCDDCGYITKHPIIKCPKCGSIHITQYSRVIGYLRPISSFGKDRQIEAAKRVYSKGI